jgi:hypothetical protein
MPGEATHSRARRRRALADARDARSRRKQFNRVPPLCRIIEIAPSGGGAVKRSTQGILERHHRVTDGRALSRAQQQNAEQNQQWHHGGSPPLFSRGEAAALFDVPALLHSVGGVSTAPGVGESVGSGPWLWIVSAFCINSAHFGSVTGTGAPASKALYIASRQARSGTCMPTPPTYTNTPCPIVPGAGVGIAVCAETGMLQTRSAISAATKVFMCCTPRIYVKRWQNGTCAPGRGCGPLIRGEEPA